MEQALSQYEKLLLRLEEKFSEIQSRYPSEFHCRLGCHSCCKPGLTVSPIEAESIENFLQKKPELVKALENLEQANPHQGKRCRFLSLEGECQIYEVRPLVCRSHGAPLQMRPLHDDADENVRIRDVCPLNFQGQDIRSLPAEAVLNLDTLNALLALLNKMAFPGKEIRSELRINSFLKSASIEKNDGSGEAP